MTVRMFSEPVLELDYGKLNVHLSNVREKKRELLESVEFGKDELMSNPKFAELLIRLGVEPYWRDNAPVTWPEGFKNGKPITAEAAILAGEPSPEVAPVPTVKASPKAKPAAATKATKAVKAKKPKTKSKRVSRPKAAK